MSELINQREAEAEEVEGILQLPPGFRFHPRDDEIITHYLTNKAINRRFVSFPIADADLNKMEPWDLPGKAKMGEKEWWFFSRKDRKYPTGTRANRATAAGYWKATGKDKEIFRHGGDQARIGMKKTLVFYRGRAPQGAKTDWVMHEFRLDGTLPPRISPPEADEWAVCKVFNKALAAKKEEEAPAERVDSPSYLDEVLLDPEFLPPLVDPSICAVRDAKAEVEEVIDFRAPQPSTSAPLYPPALAAAAGGSGWGWDEAVDGDLGATSAIRKYCKREQSSWQAGADWGAYGCLGMDGDSLWAEFFGAHR